MKKYELNDKDTSIEFGHPVALNESARYVPCKSYDPGIDLLAVHFNLY